MFDVIAPYIPQLVAGLGVTLKVAVGSFLLALVLAILAVPLTLSRSWLIRRLIAGYVAVIRGVPELLVIFLIFYGGTVALTALMGGYVEVNALSAGISAMAAVTFAYLLEILRAALQSIPQGQREAARMLGLSPRQTFLRVLMPQMLQRALPGIGNQWLVALKDSALVSVVGLEELMRKSVVAAGATHEPLVFYMMAAAIFIGITAISSAIFGLGERRLSVGR